METINIKTVINANLQTVFDLSRSIDLHIKSGEKTKEVAISGRTKGLICLGESTRWRAKHFGIWFELEIKITQMSIPFHFTDEMTDGNFRMMKHKHIFEPVSDSRTMMIDKFQFQSPYGYIGLIIDKLFMKKYLTSFLLERNRVLKEHAEDVHLKQ